VLTVVPVQGVHQRCYLPDDVTTAGLKMRTRPLIQRAVVVFSDDCSMPVTLFSLRTKRCSQSLYLTIGRTKSVAHCGNFWRRSLAFSWVRALRGLPLPGRLLTVSRNFLNSLLTPCLVQLLSGNSSVNLFAVYPFEYKLFIKILSSSLNIMLIVDKHCRTPLRWRISDATNWSPK